MSGTKRFTNLKRLARNIRDTLGTEDTTDTKNYYLLFAYNGTGKTRLSGEFKNLGKRRILGSEETTRDTLYYPCPLYPRGDRHGGGLPLPGTGRAVHLLRP